MEGAAAGKEKDKEDKPEVSFCKKKTLNGKTKTHFFILLKSLT